MPFPRGPYSGPYDLVVLLKLLVTVLILGWAFVFLVSHPDLLTIIFLLLVVGIALAVTHIVFTVLHAQYLSRWGPVRTARAVVTRKWTEEHDYGLPVAGGPVGHALADALDQDAVPTLYESCIFWAAFDMGTGKEEEFRLPEAIYASLEEGMEGRLTYRGEKLLEFMQAGLSDPPPSSPPSHS